MAVPVCRGRGRFVRRARRKRQCLAGGEVAGSGTPRRGVARRGRAEMRARIDLRGELGPAPLPAMNRDDFQARPSRMTARPACPSRSRRGRHRRRRHAGRDPAAHAAPRSRPWARRAGTLPRRSLDATPLLDQVAAFGRIARRHGVITLDRSVIADPDVAAAIARSSTARAGRGRAVAGRRRSGGSNATSPPPTCGPAWPKSRRRWA